MIFRLDFGVLFYPFINFENEMNPESQNVRESPSLRRRNGSVRLCNENVHTADRIRLGRDNTCYVARITARCAIIF